MNNLICRIDRLLLTDRKRIPVLDTLRALAIILVLLVHTYDRTLKTFKIETGHFFNFVMGFGWVGVNIFFALSGFLIGLKIYSKLQENCFSFKDFYINRFLRIVPAAYVYLLIDNWKSIGLNYQTFCNFAFISNYTNNIFVIHYWTLCVEEQFYLIFPVFLLGLFLFVRGEGKKLIFSLLTVVAAVVLLRFAYVLITGSGYYMFSQYHIDFLLVGVIAAVLYYHDMIPRVPFSLILWVLPVGYIISAFLTTSINSNTMILGVFAAGVGYPFIALWCSSLVMFAGVKAPSSLNFLFLSPFRWIAALSYSMYLYHLTVFWYVDFNLLGAVYESPNVPQTLKVLIAMAGHFFAVVLVALLSFLIVERPFLKLRSYILRVNKSA